MRLSSLQPDGSWLRFTGKAPLADRRPEHVQCVDPTEVKPPQFTPEGFLPFLGALERRRDVFHRAYYEAHWSHDLLGLPESADAFVQADIRMGQHWYHTPIREWLDRFAHTLIPRLFSNDKATSFQWDYFRRGYLKQPASHPDEVPSGVLASAKRVASSQHILALLQAFSQRGGKGRAAWFKPAGETRTLGQQFLALVEARNASVQNSLQSNYYDNHLNNQHHIDPYHWRRLRKKLIPQARLALAKLDKVATHKGFVKAKQHWEQALLATLNQSSLETIVVKTAQSMGMSPDQVKKMLAKSSMFEGLLPNKTPSWYCQPLDPPMDVRVMMNIPHQPQKRTMWDYQALLHEVAGHGFDYLHLDPALPSSARRHHEGVSVETLAIHFETLLYDPLWLERVVGMPPSLIQQCKRLLEVERRRHLLRTIVDFGSQDVIEEQLYLHANKPERVMEKAMTTALNKHGFEATRGKPGMWLNHSRFIVDNTVYYPNYIMAALNAIHLDTHGKKHFGGLTNPNWMRHLQWTRKDGLLVPWETQWQTISGTGIFTDQEVPDVLAPLTQAI